MVLIASNCSASNPLRRKRRALARNATLIQPSFNMSSLLTSIMKDYDKNMRPFYGVKSVDVKVDILILSFGEIQEANMVCSGKIPGLTWV